MQALAAMAGRASAAQVAPAPVPPQAAQRSLGIGCGYEALDAWTGGFTAGQLTVLDASSALLWDVSLGALCQATRHGWAVAVDGGNSLDPYILAKHARRAGLAPRRALQGMRIARAFTAYQLSALLEETLLDEVIDHTPALVLVSCLPEMYMDEDVPWVEANALVERAMALLRGIAREHGCAVLATNAGPTKLASRPRLRTLVYTADRVVRLLAQGDTVVLEDLPSGRRTAFRAPARGQATLENFDGPQLGAPPPLAAPQQLMLRGMV